MPEDYDSMSGDPPQVPMKDSIQLKNLNNNQRSNSRPTLSKKSF